jgi:hypothetical protein
MSPRYAIDPLDCLLLHLDADSRFKEAFFATTTPAEVIDLVNSAGIVVTEQRLHDLLHGKGIISWFCGGSEHDPIKHLEQVFGMDS